MILVRPDGSQEALSSKLMCIVFFMAAGMPVSVCLPRDEGDVWVCEQDGDPAKWKYACRATPSRIDAPAKRPWSLRRFASLMAARIARGFALRRI